MQQLLRAGLYSVVIVAAVATANARPITHSSDSTTCDGGTPLANHELGNPAAVGAAGFPADQAIRSASTFTQQSACPSVGDNPDIPNRVVSITNLTSIDWTDLWFVADEFNGLSNVDLVIADTTPDAAPGSPFVFTRAFRIDTIGVNTPLISESIAANLVFEPGETWLFIVQDWTPPGLDPGLMGSIGFAGRSPLPDSNASVIAFDERQVPAPAALALFATALSTLAWMRRRRR